MASSKPLHPPPLTTTTTTATTPIFPPNARDRPWLLPSNRKLRNLTSLSLRNLTLHTNDTHHHPPYHHHHTPSSPTASRRRGRTIVDDDAIPQTLQSPAKIVARREEQRNALEHSRSSEDLKAMGQIAPSHRDVEETASKRNDDDHHTGKGGGGRSSSTKRPSMKKLRRRSTLEWANATPQRRQETLENVTAERLADAVFFTLHVARGFEEPIYISESVEKTMNPTFRHIDFSPCAPGVTRLDEVVVKVWARSVTRKREGRWRLLMEMEIALKELVFLGKSLENFRQPLPPNAIIFLLTDGIYTTFSSLPTYIPPPPSTVGPARTNTTRPLPTTSFDALLRLAKLDDSIQDALSTRDKLASDLYTLYRRNKDALNERDGVAEIDDRVKTIDYAKKTVEKQVEKARRQLGEKRESLRLRRQLMEEDLATRDLQRRRMHETRPEFPHYRDERAVTKAAVQNQRRRICEDLQKIYPISPIPDKSLAFTIRALYLPNSDDLDDAASADTLAAALGSVSHLVLLLSFYLSQPLPYPLNPRGSASTVEDLISILQTTKTKTPASTSAAPKSRAQSEKAAQAERLQRTYPLFTRGGVPRFRFEYAVFLLNKNIQILLEQCFRVRVVDVRQTLVNLKYLLYVATAGEGELPARKAGGVRGLLRGKRMREGSPGGSSVASSDAGSTLVVGGGGMLEGNGRVKGAGGGAAESLRGFIGSEGMGRKGKK